MPGAGAHHPLVLLPGRLHQGLSLSGDIYVIFKSRCVFHKLGAKPTKVCWISNSRLSN